MIGPETIWFQRVTTLKCYLLTWRIVSVIESDLDYFLKNRKRKIDIQRVFLRRFVTNGDQGIPFKESTNLSETTIGKISAQPHPTLCIQFLIEKTLIKTIHCHRENNFVLQLYGALWKFYLTNCDRWIWCTICSFWLLNVYDGYQNCSKSP